MTAPAASGTWRSRILGSGEEAPDQLVANPRNWRTHPPAQRMALRGALDTLGWVQQVVVNKRTGNVVDGHARIEEALSRGEPTVPVLYVDLSEDEELLALATLDPIAAMAAADDERLQALLDEVSVDDEGLAELLGRYRIDIADPVTLSDAERDGFRQMSFIVTDEQSEAITSALRRAIAAGPFDTGNANGNGNALARIAEAYP